MKILAVDDDDVFGNVLRAALAESGFGNVGLAASARQALAMVNAQDDPFDCFLLDVRMPGMDGIELCRELRKMEQNADAPIIMITVVQDRERIAAALQAGADDYLCKPLDMLELTSRLRSAAKAVTLRRRALEAHRKVNTLVQELDELNSLPLDASISFTGVPGFVDPLLQKNFLLSVPPDKLHGFSSVAFRVLGIADLHATLRPNEFREMLRNLTRTIATSLCPDRALLAYHGTGGYVLLSSTDREQILAREIPTVTEAADQVLRHYGRFTGHRASIQAGNVVRLGLFESVNPCELISRALADVGLGHRPAA